ncbi:MAG: class I SAM-dependent methyltransferase [Candidatus Adiutrix sp.]|jgi:SAM-dependent methyltransferase|nr:class I SAM-dependent methyltransferase [Candidatus Adiutrix sp.]
MKIMDIIRRVSPARPGADGEKIPWDDPEFSRRMLANHLSQDHDWASRRADLIGRQADWIAANLGPGSSRILDLACGPGLYTHLLAERGHQCVGVDFSPASVAYARTRAEAEGLPARYVLSDIRLYRDEDQYDCVMFVFGEFNAFAREEAAGLLAAAAQRLKPGGLFILEGHTFKAVKEAGLAPASWWSCEAEAGILSPRPHLCLQENFWDEAAAVAVTRYYIIDPGRAEVREFRSALTGYALKDYERLFARAGFSRPRALDAAQWPAGDPFIGQMTTLTAVRL